MDGGVGHRVWATAKGYACVIRSDVPVVVQHTRLDSRQAESALLSTVAFPVVGSGPG